MNQKLSPRRRALSFLLALSLMLGLLPPTSAQAAEGASAAPPEHWAASYLNQMVEWGFIRADQAQNPDRALTRADFMSIVNRAYGYHEVGETPFEDVSEYDWFYDDVGIAYNAGYIKGTSPTTASPNDPLNRETATTILGRNMMLQESPGELLDFSDARDISNWARGTIKSSMEHYLVNGYDDGTFRPKQSMNWGEIAALVTRTIGTPLQDEGDYSLGGVFGNVTVTSPGVTLRDTVISGDLYVTGGVGLGGIKLENVTVLGRIIASGTGSSEGGASILLRNVTADELLIDNLQDKEVSIQADGITEIGKTTVRTSAFIQDNTPDGLGLHMISLEGDYYGEDEEVPEGWEPPRLTLAGRVEEVVNKTPNSTVHAAKGTVAKLTVDEAATGSHVVIDRGAVVENLILDTGVDVTGEGDIGRLEVNAPGCDVEMLPDEIVIRPGITAIIAGEEMDSASADEFLLDPMILAGYPKAQDIAPTSLEAVFATNKKGRIYWAVSAITDGSIGADELIKPPSYGNKAVKWGTVDSPRGNEETIAQITGLQPGGSYYLSAVLEDAKGQLSPVKVISFTTPDNTVPAFNTGYPHMSKVSPKDSVVVTMTNKDCKLYYALLPEGATPPTENEMKTNAVAGALGYGVRDAYKNTEDAFRVNDQILQEQTTYVLYFFLCDADGVNKSPIISITFKTSDETPPFFVVEPTVTKVDKTSVTMTFTLNEDGVVYWVAIPANTTDYPKPEPGTDYDTAPPNSMYGMLQIENGMNIGADGKYSGQKGVVCKGNVPGTITVSGLKPETSYDFYYMAKDTAGNYTEVWKKITISPLDETGPKFSQSFSESSSLDGKSDPASNTDIYLDVTEDVRYTGEGGGTSFLTLYQAVKDARSETERNTAKNRLAASLYGAIQLHQIDLYDNSEEIVDSKWQTSQQGDNWVIDYTEATVEAHEGGIRITFPSKALHLENGGQYYFTITKVTDVSSNQNPIVPSTVDFYTNEALSKGGGHDVPVFIVEFARVDFSTPGMDDMPIKRDAGGTPIAPGTDGYTEDDYVRRDMSFRMKPVSTETVADNIRYDLLLWTENVVTYDLYYRVVDASGNRIDTAGAYGPYSVPGGGQTLSPDDYLLPHLGPANRAEQADANGWFYLGNSGPMNPENNGWAGASVNVNFNGCKSLSLPQLSKLNSNLRYEVIIHLTSMEDVPEEQNGQPTWKTWNGEVKFYANVAAGQGDNLENLGNSLTQKNWKDWQDKGLGQGARSIGRNSTREEPLDTQKLSRLFTDSRLPRFDGDAPTFEPDATSVDVNLRFSTAGTLYYVVGKADTGTSEHLPEITTIRTLATDYGYPEGAPESEGGTLHPVTGGNGTYDIRLTDMATDGKTVLAPPTNGATMPGWMLGGIKEGLETDDPEKENLIVRPTNQYIFNPKGQAETANAISGNFPFKGRTLETLTIEGLTPETDYFAYFVIKGEGNALSHVYIYQFTTPEATKPQIRIDNYTNPKNKDEGGATFKTPNTDSRLRYLVYTLDDAQAKLTLLKRMVTVPQSYYNVSNIKSDMTPKQTTEPTKYPLTNADGTPMTDGSGKPLYQAVDEEGNPLWELPALQAMTTLDSNGYSVFDNYADDTLKENMFDFLNGNLTTWSTDPGLLPVNPNKNWMDMKQNVGKDETLPIYVGTDYVVLAMAHIPEASDDDWQAMSFGGKLPLRLGSQLPPEGIDGYGDLQMGKRADTEFTGTITITFDRQLYSPTNTTELLNNANVLSILPNWNMLGLSNRIQVSVTSTQNQTQILFTGKWMRADRITIAGDNIVGAGGVRNGSKRAIIEVNELADHSGMYTKVEWGTTSSSKELWYREFPFNDSNVSVSMHFDFDGTAPSGVKLTQTGNQTLTIPAGYTAEVPIKGDIFPPGMDCVYVWSSSNTDVATVDKAAGDHTSSAKIKITGHNAGTSNVTVRVVGSDADQNPVDEKFTLTVIVNGISVSDNTGGNAGSFKDGLLTWDRDPNKSQSTRIVIKSNEALSDTNVTISGGGLKKSGDVTVISSTEISFSVISEDKSFTTPQEVTVTVGTLTCKFFVAYTGSEANVPGISNLGESPY